MGGGATIIKNQYAKIAVFGLWRKRLWQEMKRHGEFVWHW